MILLVYFEIWKNMAGHLHQRIRVELLSGVNNLGKKLCRVFQAVCFNHLSLSYILWIQLKRQAIYMLQNVITNLYLQLKTSNCYLKIKRLSFLEKYLWLCVINYVKTFPWIRDIKQNQILPPPNTNIDTRMDIRSYLGSFPIAVTPSDY